MFWQYFFIYATNQHAAEKIKLEIEGYFKNPRLIISIYKSSPKEKWWLIEMLHWDKMPHPIKKSFCQFILYLVKKYKEIPCVMINMYSPTNPTTLLAIHYKKAHPIYYPVSKNIADYDIVHAEYIRKKLFFCAIDLLPEYPGEDSPHAELERRNYTIIFETSDKKYQLDRSIWVDRYTHPSGAKTTLIIGGPRYLTLHGFWANLPTHDEETIQETIKVKLKQRGYTVKEIKKGEIHDFKYG